MDEEKKISETTERAPKKRGGRKPMSAEEKAAAAKARADIKVKADNLKPVCVVQFQGSDIDLSDLVESAKSDFHKEKKRTPITDLKLYIKPEERTAYYVVNEKHTGSISY